MTAKTVCTMRSGNVILLIAMTLMREVKFLSEDFLDESCWAWPLRL